MKYLFLWPRYIGEKGRTLGKTYGIKPRCYWEHPWGTHWEPREHIENLMRTHLQLERNMLRTKGLGFRVFSESLVQCPWTNAKTIGKISASYSSLTTSFYFFNNYFSN
jgi:predicted adenine nucleotide alpha hydrolase (AANH) superfamily ATPase